MPQWFSDLRNVEEKIAHEQCLIEKWKEKLHFFKTKESPFCFGPLIPSLSCWGSFSLVLLGWLRAARRGLCWDRCVRQCRSPAALGGGGSGLCGRDGRGAAVLGWPRLETQGNHTVAASLWYSAMRVEKKRTLVAEGNYTHPHSPPPPPRSPHSLRGSSWAFIPICN